MSNLRELLKNVCNHDKDTSQPAYALLEALVEAIDGGRHTCEECKFFNPWDVSACRNTPYFGGRRTTAMHTICDEFEALPPVAEAVKPEVKGIPTLDTGLAMSLWAAEIVRLEGQRDSWERKCQNTERRVAEAQREWGRLAKACDKAKEEIERLRQRNNELAGEVNHLCAKRRRRTRQTGTWDAE